MPEIMAAYFAKWNIFRLSLKRKVEEKFWGDTLQTYCQWRRQDYARCGDRPTQIALPQPSAQSAKMSNEQKNIERPI